MQIHRNKYKQDTDTQQQLALLAVIWSVVR